MCKVSHVQNNNVLLIQTFYYIFQVQDFRFLCPNGTAFDQEAQTCADWGDVDCEQATLYYGSDNFDLYRIGSGLESKRAPFAEEEEATFHLQRAETSKYLYTFRPHTLSVTATETDSSYLRKKKNSIGISIYL